MPDLTPPAAAVARTHHWLFALVAESKDLWEHLCGHSPTNVRRGEPAWANQLGSLYLRGWLKAAVEPAAVVEVLAGAELDGLRSLLANARRQPTRLWATFYPPQWFRADLAESGKGQSDRENGYDIEELDAGEVYANPKFQAALVDESWRDWQRTVGAIYGAVVRLRGRFPTLGRVDDEHLYGSSWETHVRVQQNIEIFGNHLLHGDLDDGGRSPAAKLAFETVAAHIRRRYDGVGITPAFLKRAIDGYLTNTVKAVREDRRGHPQTPAELAYVNRNMADAVARFNDEARPLDFDDAPLLPLGDELTPDVVTHYLEGLKQCCRRRITDEPPRSPPRQTATAGSAARIDAAIDAANGPDYQSGHTLLVNLKGRKLTFLRAMIQLDVDTNLNSRKATADIVRHIDKLADGDAWKDVVTDLKTIGYVNTTRGSGGGVYFTAEGMKHAQGYAPKGGK